MPPFTVDLLGRKISQSHEVPTTASVSRETTKSGTRSETIRKHSTGVINDELSPALSAADYFARHQRKAHLQRRDHGFAAWMVGVSFSGDVLVIAGALLLAFWLRFHTYIRQLGRTDASMQLASYHGHILFLTTSLLMVLTYFELYTSGRPQRLRKVNAILVLGTCTWFFAQLGLSFELNTLPIVSRIFLFIAFFCTLNLLLIWRWIFNRILLIPSVAELLRRRIVFVGWSEQTAKITEHITNDFHHPYQIVGCISTTSKSTDPILPETVPRLGEYAALRDILIDQSIDIAIVADLNALDGSLQEIVTVCEKELVHLQVVPSFFQVLVSGLHLETTSGMPVLGISRLPLDSPLNQFLKRILDVTGALVGLMISAPLIAVFTALVYTESPGPVFYRQRRNGLGGKPFYILKIRSMKLDAECGQYPTWPRRNDPRRLKVGALMRRWNIDEIPQFINVLAGDMSLVGPRPERPEFIVDFKENIPHYNARHGVKPGITGWAQVNGLRGDTDLTERVKCDLYYMENWSLMLDVQIMLMTFFRHANAG